MINEQKENGAVLPEGEETPPPLTKAMSMVRWGLLAALAVFALFMLLGMLGLTPWEARGNQQAQYHCPMHPTYIADHPGECPICGMSLVPIKEPTAGIPISAKDNDKTKKAGDSSARGKQYACPMHPEVTASEPGQCPKCGMDLVAVPDTGHGKSMSEPKEKADSILEKSTGPGRYVCPMHPEIVADEPGRCPKCGMFLEYQDADSISEDAEHSVDTHRAAASEGFQVAGLAPLTLELARQQLIGVRTSRAVREIIGDSLRLFGEVTADETKLRKLQLRVSGWIKKLYLNQTGQLVDRGDTIAVVYSPELYQAISEFMNVISSPLGESSPQLKAAFREKLILLGLSSADVDEIAGGAEPTAEYPLRSPFKGFLIQKNVVEGQRIDPTQELATIADLSTVWVLAGAYEHDIQSIKIGQTAAVRVEGFPGLKFEGRIGLVYPDFSPESRTGKIRIELANPKFQLKPGMLAEITVVADSKAAITVPADAVIDGGTQKYVFVVHDKTHFEPRLISTGTAIGDRMVIESGLHDGEEVVTSANFLIDSESRLKAALIGASAPAPTTNEGH